MLPDMEAHAAALFCILTQALDRQVRAVTCLPRSHIKLINVLDVGTSLLTIICIAGNG